MAMERPRHQAQLRGRHLSHELNKWGNTTYRAKGRVPAIQGMLWVPEVFHAKCCLVRWRCRLAKKKHNAAGKFSPISRRHSHKPEFRPKLISDDVDRVGVTHCEIFGWFSESKKEKYPDWREVSRRWLQPVEIRYAKGKSERNPIVIFSEIERQNSADEAEEGELKSKLRDLEIFMLQLFEGIMIIFLQFLFVIRNLRIGGEEEGRYLWDLIWVILGADKFGKYY